MEHDTCKCMHEQGMLLTRHNFSKKLRRDTVLHSLAEVYAYCITLADDSNSVLVIRKCRRRIQSGSTACSSTRDLHGLLM